MVDLRSYVYQTHYPNTNYACCGNIILSIAIKTQTTVPGHRIFF